MNNTNKLPFKPEMLTKSLLSHIAPRSREILERRYGLLKGEKRETLEAIGKDHKITRERVRQIENHAASKLCSAVNAPDIKAAFTYFTDAIEERGGLVAEKLFLENIAEKTAQKNHILFLLTLGEMFGYIREDDDFHSRWTTNDARRKEVEEALLTLAKNMDDHPLSEKDILFRLNEYLKEAKGAADTILISWFSLSKRIAKNLFGEWGPSDSAHIRPRGIRDLAYLLMRKHGSPLHFREVADGITANLNRRAHHQTVHNELIKDDRFVLVGRGLYALTEWGYQPGIVRSVIQAVLGQHGPLTRDELIKRVLKERHVKDNTIVINLQDKKYFQKLASGKYTTV